MKIALTLLFLIFIISNALCQSVVLVPGRNNQMYPAYIDQRYNIDGRQLVPQSSPQPIIIYDPIIRNNHSQDIWEIRPQGNNTWTVTPLISEDD